MWSRGSGECCLLEAEGTSFVSGLNFFVVKQFMYNFLNHV